MSFEITELLKGATRALESNPKLQHLAKNKIFIMADTGMAHHHARIDEMDLILRIPKYCPQGFDPLEHLAYEANCFATCALSNHTPRLMATLSPTTALPFGALVVDEIVGGPPDLPADIPAVAKCLASIHSLDFTEQSKLLVSPGDPVATMYTEIRRQAASIPDAGLHRDTLSGIQKEMVLVSKMMKGHGTIAPAVVTFDAQPANFVVNPKGRAFMVDLEKVRVSSPGFDLAHATLYTSTTLDTTVSVKLTQNQCMALYENWFHAMGENAFAYLPDLELTRRLMWLWTITWCVNWLVEQKKPSSVDGNAEKSGSAPSDSASRVKHLRSRIEHFLEPATIAMMRETLPLNLEPEELM